MMKCQNCDKPTERNSKFCPHCGHKKRVINPSVIIGTLLTLILFLILFFSAPFPNELVSNNNLASENDVSVSYKNKKIELVEKAQQSVFTVYTGHNQGSAFLYDQYGSIITNAHVVEGSLTATIKTSDGYEYVGNVIGYSNEIDVALISVPELSGNNPFPLQKLSGSKVGEEVIALGTPLGLENTATFGYLTGVNRTFNIPPHTFTNVYQISAPIEPGNSGGPLISIDHEKIIAINSAKSIDDENIAFSIPLYQVVPLIDEWVASPLSESEITALFYNDDGNYHYDFLWSLFDYYYFDDGHYIDEEDYHDYWLYDEDLNLWEKYNDYDPYYDYHWDGYYENNWQDLYDYDDYYEDEEHWDMWNDDYFDQYDYDDEDYFEEYEYYDDYYDEWDYYDDSNDIDGRSNIYDYDFFDDE